MKIYIPVSILVSIILFLSIAQTTQALSLPNLIDGAKNLISPQKKELKIDSSITLIPEGDITKNGQIDAGDRIKFTYKIINTTDNTYKYTTLKTNIPTNNINYIHNEYGTSSLNDDGKTITIPNLRIEPHQARTISFDAQINYFQDTDKKISTEPELLTEDKKLILKTKKEEILTKKLSAEKIKSLFKTKKNN